MARTRRGRGEGSVYQRADGTWCGSVSVGYDGNGKRRRRTVYGATKAEAQQKLREAQNSGAPVVPRLTVGEWLDRWLETSVKPWSSSARPLALKSSMYSSSPSLPSGFA